MSGMEVDELDARLVQPMAERIIPRAFKVANALGHGFVEKTTIPFIHLHPANPP
jgi:hypothetical protein